MRSHMETMFSRAWLSNVSGYVERANSHALAPPAESVIIHGTVVNAEGSTWSLELQLETSYDGQVWKTHGSALTITTSDPQAKSSVSAITLDEAYVRLRANFVTSEGTGSVLFDARLVFTHQVN